MNKEQIQLKRGIYIYIIVIFVFILLCGIWSFQSYDPLNEVLFKSECLETLTNDRNGEITGWVITHFILYFILGMVAPSQFSVWFTIGTLWELLEYFSGYMYKISGFKDKDQTFNDRWWCGSINDIIVNLFGLILGIFVNYFFNFLKKEKVFE